MNKFVHMKKPVKPKAPANRYETVAKGNIGKDVPFEHIERYISEFKENFIAQEGEGALDRVNFSISLVWENEDDFENWDTEDVVCRDDNRIVCIATIRPTQDVLDEFDDAMTEYKKDYRNWDKWRKDNKKEIEANKAGKKNKQKEAARLKEIKELRRRLRELETNEWGYVI